MELLYVWIEDFRNIKKTGFNFSKEYEVSYDNDFNQVTIETIDKRPAIVKSGTELHFRENKNYLNDFFPDNLVNVTAVIGKNSTGKSNVLDFILTTLHTGLRPKIGQTNYLFLFKDKGQLYFHGKPNASSIKDASLAWEGYPVQKLEPNSKWTSIFYSNVADQREYIFNGNAVHNFSHNEINKSQANKIGFASSSEFAKTREKIMSDGEVKQKIRFIFEPIAFEKLRKKEVHPVLRGIFERYRIAIYKADSPNYNKFKYGLTLSFFCYLYSKNDIQENQIKSVIIHNEIAEPIADLHPKLIEFIKDFDFGSVDDEHLSLADFHLFVKLIQSLEDRTNEKLDFGKIEKNSSFIIIEFNDVFIEFIADLVEVFNKTEIVTHDWDKLSSGMKAYLSIYSQLYSAKENINSVPDKSLLLCIDEGDLYMHPEWQIKFLSDLIEFVTTNFESNKIQIILTSHSPFLISDLPKESVLLLDEKGVVNRQLNDPSSFGANIHQLFTNQFFLSDGGTMGAFAQSKIKELYNSIESITPTDLRKTEALIEMVGEPILRYRLKDKLKIKVATFPNKAKIDWHLNQIEKIKSES